MEGDVLIPIATCAELQGMRDDVSLNYELVADIDCTGSESYNSGQGFEPIGGEDPFTGILQGNGYRISNLYISRDASSVGLFSHIGNNGRVYNLQIRNGSFAGVDSVGPLAGTIADDVTIDNVAVTGTPVYCANYCGGVVGQALDHASLTAIQSSSNIGGGVAVGGVVGQTEGVVQISNSYFDGTLVGESGAGGIVGDVLASFDGGATITATYSAGSVDGGTEAGGIVGNIEDGVLTHSFVAGPVTAGAYYGALVGIVQNPDMENSDNFVDQDRAFTSSCSGSFGFDCTLVNTAEEPNATYFFNNYDVPPLDSWNFESVWYTRTNDFPKLTATDTFVIEASAGTHGTIDPSGEVFVSGGSDQSFTITPASGYEIDDVVVDDESVGKVTSYEFNDVNHDHTIAATFVAESTDGGDPDDGGGDSGGTGSGSESGSGSSTGSGPIQSFNPEALTDATSGETVRIVLNDFLDYLNSLGKTLELEVGQVVYFNVGEEEHSATIKEIGDGFVVITLRSTPQDVTLRLGQTNQYDVTEDKTNDIQITLNSIANSKATLTFKALTKPTETKQVTAPKTGTTAPMNWYWLIAAIIVIIALVLFIIIWNKQREKEKGKR